MTNWHLPRGDRTSVRGRNVPQFVRDADGYVDVSWGNDTCDSVRFIMCGVGFHLWIEAPARGDREDDTSPLYCVQFIEEVTREELEDHLDDLDIDTSYTFETDYDATLEAFLEAFSLGYRAALTRR